MMGQVLMHGSGFVDITIFCQKIFANCHIGEPIQRGLLHSAKALWNAFLVTGLGLIPLNGGSRLKFAGAHGAFELLRVRNPSLSITLSPILTPFPNRCATDLQRRAHRVDTET